MDARIAVCIFYATLSAVTTVVLIVGFIRFKSMMHLAIVRRRYPRIVVLENVLAIVVTLFFGTLYLLDVYQLEELSEYQRAIHNGMGVVYPLCHLVIYCEACRLWLISYDLHHLHWTQNNAWKLQINSKFGERNWWLTHRQTYGNSRYVTPRMLGCGLISGVIASSLFQVFGVVHWVHGVDALLYVCPLLFILRTYFQCPKTTNDLFLFLTEFKYTSIIYVLILSVYMMGSALIFFYFVIGHLIIACSAWVGFSWVSILSTLVIPKQIALKKEWGAVNPHDIPNEEDDQDDTVGELCDVFRDAERFASFVSFINREFALESLLAFIEFVQFKQRLKQIYFNDGGEAVELQDLQIVFDFGDQPLKSEIVYDTVEFGVIAGDDAMIGGFKRIAYMLYVRYVSTASELEVNISGKHRMRLSKLIKNETHWLYEAEITAQELLVLFDAVCIELHKLMSHTFYRFKAVSDPASDPEPIQTMLTIPVVSTQ